MTSPTPLPSLPDLAFSLPKDCSQKLLEIIQRHRVYMSAKTNGQLSTRKEELKSFKTNAVSLKETTGSCALCLETMNSGEKVIELPCGHKFHSGSLKRKRARSETCKGILYWLNNNSSCPQCRFDLPTDLPQPSESERLLLPILHRQNKLIARQMAIIRSQKKQIDLLTKKEEEEEKSEKETETNIELVPLTPTDATTQKVKNLKFPKMSWQSSECLVQKETRKQVLQKITTVTLKDIVVRGASNEQMKNERLQELAAKIEFILYCCSSSFEEYKENTTLRERTLKTVKHLADRARALKLQPPTSQPY